MRDLGVGQTPEKDNDQIPLKNINYYEEFKQHRLMNMKNAELNLYSGYQV